MSKSRRPGPALPAWKRNAINSAIAIALAGLASASAAAMPLVTTCPASIDGTITSNCTLTGNSATTVTTSGAVTVGGNSSAIRVAGDTGISLTNKGTISAGVGASGYSWATGVYVIGNLVGSITNSGTIAAEANSSGSSNAYAYGIDVANLSGSVNNTGTIRAVANATGSTAAYAYGVYVGGALDGHLTNGGTISATATAATYDAYAYGVYVNNDLSGTLTNDGTISATAINNGTSNGSRASAYGVYVSGDLSGGLTNNGTISAYAENAYSYAYAYGVYVNGALTGSLTNSGAITATARTLRPSAAYAYGIYVSGDVTGSLTNSGTISATAISRNSAGTSGNNATAYSIYLDGMLTGQLTNSGTISARAEGRNANAYGLIMYGNPSIDVGGSLVNTGTIAATAVGTHSAYAAGIYTDWPVYGTLANSGTVSAVATTTGSGNANATGVFIYTSLGDTSTPSNGSLTNTGTISALASANSGNATAYGVYISGDLNGGLTNTGTIRAVATAKSGSAYAYGVYVDGNLNGTLTNSGTISGTADIPANGYSLYVTGGTGGVINNLAGGTLAGNLYVQGTVTVNNAGTIDLPAGGTGSISGTYTQQAGGILAFGAASAGSYARLTVGTANLTAGNLAIHATPKNTLAVGDTLSNVLSATTLNTGGATTLNVVGTPMFTYAGTVVGGNMVDVAITGKTTIAGLLTGTSSSALTGVGATLDGLAAAYTGGGALDPLVDALYATNSAAELTHDVEQLVPQIGMGLANATGNVGHDISRIIQVRQDGNRGLSSGDEFYGDKHFWLKPFGSRADQGSRDGVAGYLAKTAGVAFGFDGRLNNATRLGGAFTYANTSVKANGAAQTGSVGTYQLTFYGSQNLDERTALDFQADYGVHKNDEARGVAIGAIAGTATASYNAWSAHLGAGVSRLYALNTDTAFVPSLRADYTYLNTDGYTESGTLARLSVSGNKTDELIVGVDGKVTHSLGNGTSLVANLGAGYDTLSKRDSITSSFVNGGAAFTTQGINPSPWVVRGGLGVLVTNSKAMEITARYDVESRSSNFTNQTASVKVRIPF